MMNDSLFTGLILTVLIGLLSAFQIYGNINSRNTILAAIKGNGCASHLEMPEPKNLKRIDVYKGNE